MPSSAALPESLRTRTFHPQASGSASSRLRCPRCETCTRQTRGRAVLYLVRRLRQPAIGHGVGLVGFLEGNRIGGELLEATFEASTSPSIRSALSRPMRSASAFRFMSTASEPVRNTSRSNASHDEGGAGPHGPLACVRVRCGRCNGPGARRRHSPQPMGGHEADAMGDDSRILRPSRITSRRAQSSPTSVRHRWRWSTNPPRRRVERTTARWPWPSTGRRGIGQGVLLHDDAVVAVQARLVPRRAASRAAPGPGRQKAARVAGAGCFRPLLLAALGDDHVDSLFGHPSAGHRINLVVGPHIVRQAA